MKFPAVTALLLAAALGAQTRPEAKSSPAARAAIPSYKELKYPPLRPVKIPDVATFTLPNGIRLYLVENHELPLVRGSALVRAGNLFDPPDKVGLATITGMVMRTGGTTAKSGDQLDEQFAPNKPILSLFALCIDMRSCRDGAGASTVPPKNVVRPAKHESG